MSKIRTTQKAFQRLGGAFRILGHSIVGSAGVDTSVSEGLNKYEDWVRERGYDQEEARELLEYYLGDRDASAGDACRCARLELAAARVEETR